MSSLKLRDYQVEAIDNWFNNNNFGIFEMATDTLPALNCIYLINGLLKLKIPLFGIKIRIANEG